jgi:protease I
MANKLKGLKIAVMVESEFIPEEIAAYQTRFPELGAKVDLISRLWGNPSAEFVSDIVDDPASPPTKLTVNLDFQNVAVEDYAAVIMAANYCSVRLRYFDPPSGESVKPEDARTAPAVSFFARAMANKKIVKGALCHGLWILTPRPELLKGRHVVCHEVVISDITNAGGVFVPAKTGVHVDRDLVTGRSKNEVLLFIDTIAQQISLASKA